jgi:hypothetical protein
MEASWESVISAVELGHLHAPDTAVIDPSGPVPGDSQEVVVPSYKGSIFAGTMGPENATPGPVPNLQRGLLVVENSNPIVVDDSALGPHSVMELPSLSVILGSARFQCILQAQHPQGIAHLSELQLGTEPKRIWNRISLALLDCALDRPNIRSVSAAVETAHSKPEMGKLAPDIPEPNTRIVEPLSPEGLPAKPHSPLRHAHHSPAAALVERRPVAPRLRVPLPSPPRMR